MTEDKNAYNRNHDTQKYGDSSTQMIWDEEADVPLIERMRDHFEFRHELNNAKPPKPSKSYLKHSIVIIAMTVFMSFWAYIAFKTAQFFIMGCK